MSDDVLIEAVGLGKRFPVRQGLVDRLRGRPAVAVTAVDEVNLDVRRGEILALVGESGCGKSTLSRCLLRLVEPTAGEVRFGGENILAMDEPALRVLRPRMQIIFQDPYSSLNPRLTVRQAISEVLRVHHVCPADEIEARVEELATAVGLPVSALDRHPRSFSGGQQQRIGIARALAANPEFLVADEAVSRLDVSVQVQILNLLRSLRRDLGLTIFLVAHDLAVVRYVSDRVAVMYLGTIVELAPTEGLYEAPAHPYTQALLESVPRLEAGLERREPALVGEPPSPLNMPTGCRFRTRCKFAQPRCAQEEPILREVAPGHRVACHFPLAGSGDVAPAASKG